MAEISIIRPNSEVSALPITVLEDQSEGEDTAEAAA
jgi:hypothetical protein